jgi:hypothetical protein
MVELKQRKDLLPLPQRHYTHLWLTLYNWTMTRLYIFAYKHRVPWRPWPCAKPFGSTAYKLRRVLIVYTWETVVGVSDWDTARCERPHLEGLVRGRSAYDFGMHVTPNDLQTEPEDLTYTTYILILLTELRTELTRWLCPSILATACEYRMSHIWVILSSPIDKEWAKVHIFIPLLNSNKWLACAGNPVWYDGAELYIVYSTFVSTRWGRPCWGRWSWNSAINDI